MPRPDKDAPDTADTSQYSVIMAVYEKDKPEWLEMALDSILLQTVPSNDIVIVIDGPISDSLEHTLQKYNSSSINYIRLSENKGLGNALNVALEHVKNELVGRMDSDDISTPDRFELQLAEFSKSPSLGILGGQIAEFIDNPDEIVAYRIVPTTNVDIAKFARRRSPFNHPTVMYRKSIIQNLGGYDVTAIRIEDYDLWLRAISKNTECANLDETLLCYRSTTDAMRRRKTLTSLKSHVVARFRFYSKGYTSSPDLIHGILTQLILFVLPTSMAKLLFNRAVRRV